MQFFVIPNIFNHKMSLENVKEVLHPHKLLCLEVLNIGPVLCSSWEWGKKCWKEIRIISSNPRVVGIAKEQNLRREGALPGCPAGPLAQTEKHILCVLRAQEPKAVVPKA